VLSESLLAKAFHLRSRDRHDITCKMQFKWAIAAQCILLTTFGLDGGEP